jgi:chromosomal replication initiator protein
VPGLCSAAPVPRGHIPTARGIEVQDPTKQAVSEDLGAAWGRIQAQLRRSRGDSTYELWFAELRPICARGATLYLTGPRNKLAWVERRYADILGHALEAAGSAFRELRFVPPEAAQPEHPAGPTGRPEPARVALNPAYTFERFVIGGGNRIAHGAALAVAESPSQAYNPLFLHGPPGLGKTHLLGAIANYLGTHSPDLAVEYTTAECFTNEFVFALQSRGIERFKDRYRRIDVLLIDDVQFLEGKTSTADEFFHTFNALHEAGAQVVLSADRLPGQLSALAERLRQRFQWGLTVNLESPDLPTRLTYLDRLTGERQEPLDRDLIESIAERAGSNIRLLEGAFTRVLALSSLTGSPVSHELLDRALPSDRPPAAPTAPRVEQIQRLVAQRLAISPDQLTSSSRAAPINQARQLAMHLTRELTDLSLPAIATSFGRRDHTTVIHALRQVRRRLDADVDLQVLVGELANELRDPAIDRDRTN